MTIVGILFVRTWAVWDCSTHLAIALVVIMFGATAGGVIFLVLWKGTLVGMWEQLLYFGSALVHSSVAVSTNYVEYRAGR